MIALNRSSDSENKGKLGELAMRGIVKFFDRDRGWGFVRNPDDADDQKGLYFHSSHLHEPLTIPLAKDEDVEFDIGHNNKGQVATNVQRIETRYSGIVKDYLHTHGFISCKETGEDRIFVHCLDIVNDGFKRLEIDEEVEFYIRSSEKGKQAIKVFRVDPRPKLFKYADFQDFDQSIEELHALEASNDWEYREMASEKPHPILRSYIFHTFDRVEKEGKVIESSKVGPKRFACFNTGLVTPRQEPIFGVFQSKPHIQSSEPPWMFRGFLKESDHALTHFAEKPGLANYFTDPAELLYDARIELTINYDHIIQDNRGRFPKALQDNEYALRGVFKHAVDLAQKRVQRNYKAGVPSFHRGCIQLLLPLCMLDPERADLALVVARENEVYRASTVLTLDMAFNNARLLARPDREWLDP